MSHAELGWRAASTPTHRRAPKYPNTPAANTAEMQLGQVARCRPNTPKYHQIAKYMTHQCLECACIRTPSHTLSLAQRMLFRSLRTADVGPRRRRTEEARGSAHSLLLVWSKAKITPIQKVPLMSCARPLVSTAPPSARGACLMAAVQAPRRARSMRLRSSQIFNGVTQNCHATSFHAP